MSKKVTQANDIYEVFHTERSKGEIPIPQKRDFSYRTLLPHLDRLLQKDKKVLDIGCGNGALSFFAASKGCQVFGIDVSKKAILGCQINAQRLDLSKNLIFHAKNFNNPRVKIVAKFDLVICSEVLEHLPNDLQVLKRIYQLLKPGGMLFLSTPSKNSPIHKLRMFFLKKDSFDEEVGHLRRYRLQQLVLLLKKINFKILETYKTEGVLRNFFYVTAIGTKLQRFLKRGICDIISYVDNCLLFLGESDLIVIASKPI